MSVDYNTIISSSETMGNKLLLAENPRTYRRMGITTHKIIDSLNKGYVRAPFIPLLSTPQMTPLPVIVDYLDLLTTSIQKPRIQNDAAIAMVMATSAALIKKYDLMLSINNGGIEIKKNFKKFKFLRGY